MDRHHVDIDSVTGVSTTGHSWDGIKELNQPLPRWWLWLFIATVVWAAGYMLLYPAWPLVTGATGGLLGWHSRAAVAVDLAALQATRAPMTQKLSATPIADVAKDPELFAFTRALGRTAFGDNCAPCHGAGGGGAKGFPNLNDDDWLWGGKLADIQTTITHGIRWTADENTRVNAMPAFGKTGVLDAAAISNVADYVRGLSGLPTSPGADLAAGKKIFAENCVSCHGEGGRGNHELGAPNLTDAVWFYGPDKTTIVEGLVNGRGAAMPAWAGRLDPTTIKALAIYVHSMGGGQPD
jgi:cytochrome c oxidase cbb3-type subunit 3